MVACAVHAQRDNLSMIAVTCRRDALPCNHDMIKQRWRKQVTTGPKYSPWHLHSGEQVALNRLRGRGSGHGERPGVHVERRDANEGRHLRQLECSVAVAIDLKDGHASRQSSVRPVSVVCMIVNDMQASTSHMRTDKVVCEQNKVICEQRY